VRSLLDAPSPAVLATYRKDGSALVTPIWFEWNRAAFEIVIAEDDIKLSHLKRDPRCVLVVFESVPPFRGIEVRGEPELVRCDVTSVRSSIAGRYLGVRDGERFAQERRAKRLGSGGGPARERSELRTDETPRRYGVPGRT
jgi:hypothetical protein